MLQGCNFRPCDDHCVSRWNPLNEKPMHKWLDPEKQDADSERMKMLGNQVVPAQATLAFETILKMRRDFRVSVWKLLLQYWQTQYQQVQHNFVVLSCDNLLETLEEKPCLMPIIEFGFTVYFHSYLGRETLLDANHPVGFYSIFPQLPWKRSLAWCQSSSWVLYFDSRVCHPFWVAPPSSALSWLTTFSRCEETSESQFESFYFSTLMANKTLSSARQFLWCRAFDNLFRAKRSFACCQSSTAAGIHQPT